MATRLYGVPTTAAPVSPGFGAWTATTGAVRRSLSLTKSGTAEQRTNVAVTSGAGNNALAFQLVSEPLNGAQTITGTVTIVTRGRELATQDNIGSRVRTIKVYSNDGNTLRGTLLALGAHSVTTELGTTLAGYPAANGQALSSVSAQNGDRIVVELGYGMTTTGTTPLYDMSIGGTGTDHANAEGDGTGTIPWVEFSQNLAFQATAQNVDLAPLTFTMSDGDLSPEVPGAVALDAVGPSSAGAVSNGTGILSWNHTVTDSDGAALVVAVAAGIPVDGATDLSVKLDPSGANITIPALGTEVHSNGATAGFVQLFGLPNVSAGTHEISITATTSGQLTLTGGSVSYSNADTTNPFSAQQSATGDSTTPGVTFTGSTAGSRTFGATGYGSTNGTSVTSGTSRFIRIDNNTTGAGNIAGADIASDGSDPLAWSLVGQDWWSAVAVEIEPAGGAASVALSPLSFTLGQGSVVPTPSVALSPLSFTFGQGSVVPTPSVALSPLSFTLGQGTVAPSVPVTPENVALDPITVTLGLGTVQPTAVVALSPITITAGLGTVSAQPTVALSPITMTLALADLNPSGVTAGAVALSPITTTLGLGTVSARPTVGLSPLTTTLGLGTTTPTPTIALSPVTVTLTPGTVSARPSVGLSPITISLGLGTVSARPTVGLSPATVTLGLAALSPAGVTPGAVQLFPITLALGLGAVIPTPTVNLSPITTALTLGAVTPRPIVGLDPVTIGLGLGTLNPAAQPVNIQLNPIGLTLGLGAIEAAGPSIGQVTGRLSEPRLGGTVGAGPLSGHIPTPNLEGGL